MSKYKGFFGLMSGIVSCFLFRVPVSQKDLISLFNHVFRYDIFPSLRWMKKRHRCSTVKAILLYPRRIGKLLWVAGRME
jgi:hypothetical protein